MISLKFRRFRIKLYPGEVSKYINEPGGDVFRELDRRMTRVQFFARRYVGVRTGKLAASIRKQYKSNARRPYMDVIAGGRGFRYTWAQEFGAEPHIIRARRKGRYLRIPLASGVVFRKQVHHPGNKGKYFLSRGLEHAGVD